MASSDTADESRKRRGAYTPVDIRNEFGVGETTDRKKRRVAGKKGAHMGIRNIRIIGEIL